MEAGRRTLGKLLGADPDAFDDEEDDDAEEEAILICDDPIHRRAPLDGYSGIVRSRFLRWRTRAPKTQQYQRHASISAPTRRIRKSRIFCAEQPSNIAT